MLDFKAYLSQVKEALAEQLGGKARLTLKLAVHIDLQGDVDRSLCLTYPLNHLFEDPRALAQEIAKTWHDTKKARPRQALDFTGLSISSSTD